MMEDGKKGYFEAALSDFVFDVAAGGAIRHLVDRGHSVEQIMGELDYPVPRARVEKAVYRYLKESGILLDRLPAQTPGTQIALLQETANEKLPQTLAKRIGEYGEENSYMECPFGQWRKKNGEKFEKTIACLSSREQEYIRGILWEQDVMYHRLNGRMREIGMKLARHTEEAWKFYFLKKSD